MHSVKGEGAKQKKYYCFISAFPTLILVLIVFVLSLVISPYYINGDQVHYRLIYEGFKNLNLVEGFIFYTLNLDSKEVVHFFLSWVASNAELDKDLFVAVSNAFLAYLVVLLLRKWKVSIFVIAIILLTNFYFYVLYFAAERLKFGFIFLVLSFLYVRYTYVFVFLSVISHAQTLIIYISVFFNVFVKQALDIIIFARVKSNILIIFVVILALFLVMWFFLGEHLLSKFDSYYVERSFADLGKIFVFFILSLWYSKSKIQVVFVFIPMTVAVFLLGGERVNMMGYFIFLYYALSFKKGLNLGVLVTSVYFALASFGFVENVIEHGDAFYES